MTAGRMPPTKVKSGRNVDLTFRLDSRLAFRRQVRQTHGMHRTQGIIFADEYKENSSMAYARSSAVRRAAERVRVLLRLPPGTSGWGGGAARSLSGRELLASVTNTGRWSLLTFPSASNVSLCLEGPLVRRRFCNLIFRVIKIKSRGSLDTHLHAG